MQLVHQFQVPVDIDRAWDALTDVPRIAPCMPGASLDGVDDDGRTFSGRVKVKVGAMQLTYRGQASFTELDPASHRATLVAKAQETRGSGTARVTVNAALQEVGEGTEVTVTSDLDVTGKPAQFGRSIMSDVGDRLLSRFADRLAEELTTQERIAAPGGPAAPTASASNRPETGDAEVGEAVGEVGTSGGAEQDDVLDLLDLAAGPLARRLAPALGAVCALWLIVFLWRRRNG